jgi:CDP-diacylglycerol---glycerol-3-phosphate 3-phosphatidyltransferase
MFFTKLKLGLIVFLEPLVDRWVEKGYHPDTFTILGFAFNLVAGILYGFGMFFEGGLLMIYGSALDVVDGQVARRTKVTSPSGSLLDSSVDRYSEIAVLVGIGVHYASIGWVTTVGVASLALAGSLMVSYVRARAEGLGYECNIGVMQRAERLVFLSAASVFGALLGSPDAHVAAAMWVMAFLTNLTAFERVVHVRKLAKQDDGSSGE